MQQTRNKATAPMDPQAESSQIICGDVLTVLRSGTVKGPFDMVIADPPYNIGKDFGISQDNMSMDDYSAWSQEWLTQCLTLLADDGIMYVYGFAEILAHIAVRHPLHAQRWLVWHYTNKATPASTFWQRSHESILCLWHEQRARPRLLVDQIREPYTQGFLNGAVGKQRASTHSRFSGTKKRRTHYRAHEHGALPRDVIKVPALAGGAGASERWFMCHDCGDRVFPPNALDAHRTHTIFKHPTQKPMALTKRLLLSRLTPSTGRVLIPFVGSGSECVVAKRMGMEYVGIEVNPLYVDFARQWIAQENTQKNTQKNTLGNDDDISDSGYITTVSGEYYG